MRESLAVICGRNREGCVRLESTKVFFIILVSIVGMGYVYTGKKSANYVFVLSGILMMLFPYLISNAIVVIIVSTALIVGPFFIKR